MGIPILLMGKSGTGKSASLRNFVKDEIAIINVLNKPLPFRTKLVTYSTQDYSKLKNALLQSKLNDIVIDDAGYLITAEFMRRAQEKGYEKFTELANHFYDLVNFIIHELPSEKIVTIIMHEEESDLTGAVKPKTIGKLLDEKVCIEGMFSIVIRSMKNENRYVFRTQTNGFDLAKTPIGLFEEQEIDNDLKYVLNEIRKYYNIEEKK